MAGVMTTNCVILLVEKFYRIRSRKKAAGRNTSIILALSIILVL